MFSFSYIRDEWSAASLRNYISLHWSSLDVNRLQGQNLIKETKDGIITFRKKVCF